MEDLVTGLSQPRGLALDAAGGRLYWTDPRAEKIQRAALDGSLLEDLVAEGLEAPFGVALDAAAGKLYWTDYGTDRIQRANLDGSEIQNLVTEGLDQPLGLAVDAAGGQIYWTDRGADRIQAAGLDGAGVRTLIGTGLQSPQGLALDLGGGYLYWSDFGTDKIQRAGLDGSGVEDLVTALRAPQGLALDPAGGWIYWADSFTGKIQRAALDGTGLEDLVEDLEAPFGLALGAGLPAQRLAVGDEAATVALAGRFRDPEGGPLSYRAVSSDPAVAAAEVAGDRVSITPVAAGRTTVRVTAGDEQGLQTPLPLAVQVLPRPNRPPELSPLADRTATAGDTLTLTVRATDPDGDRLRYTAFLRPTPPSPGPGPSIRCSPCGRWPRASPRSRSDVRDPEGLAAADTFQLTVEPPNRPPTLAPLADLSATAGDTLTLTVRATDPDGGRLRYTAAAADTAIARARAVDSVLTLRPLAEGLTTIAVRVRDPEGLAAADTFTAHRGEGQPGAGGRRPRRPAPAAGPLGPDRATPSLHRPRRRPPRLHRRLQESGGGRGQGLPGHPDPHPRRRGPHRRRRHRHRPRGPAGHRVLHRHRRRAAATAATTTTTTAAATAAAATTAAAAATTTTTTTTAAATTGQQPGPRLRRGDEHRPHRGRERPSPTRHPAPGPGHRPGRTPAHLPPRQVTRRGPASPSSRSSGQLRTRSGIAYDFEVKDRYSK